jgi:hypothetical protein
MNEQSQIIPDERPKQPAAGLSLIKPWISPRTLPALAGASIPSGSIIWIHVENYASHAETYSVQPPTVSRALTDPLLASPFAILMIIGAIFLAVAVTQIIRALARCMRASASTPTSSWPLLYAAALCEALAIAGMVVLSQFAGNAHTGLHDLGSYMLFFGHAIAITFIGIIIRRLIAAPEAAHQPGLNALRGHPPHATWVTWLSFAFGFIYFFGKVLPDTQPFAQHLVFSILEMVVLLAFLSFLGRFHGFLGKEVRYS